MPAKFQEAMELLTRDVIAEGERRRQAAHEAWMEKHRYLSRDDYLEKYCVDSKVLNEAERRGWFRYVGSPYRYTSAYYPDEPIPADRLAELQAYVDADTFLVTKKAAKLLGVSVQKFAALGREGRVQPVMPTWNRDGRYDGTFYALNDLRALKEELGEPEIDKKQIQRWQNLSERQQEYLKILRSLERGKEVYYLSRRAMFDEDKKGGMWRWLERRDIDLSLKRHGLLDRGKGATLRSLAEKGYIEKNSRALRLTRSGRKLVKDMGHA